MDLINLLKEQLEIQRQNKASKYELQQLLISWEKYLNSTATRILENYIFELYE